MMRYFSGLLLLWVIYSACTADKAPKPEAPIVACDTATITSARIYAIVQQNCTNYACHPGGGAPSAANFSSQANLKAYINANKGLFAARVTAANADMPQSQGFPALPRAVRDSIACWISKGMPDQ
ncbi:hypothetical protein MKQ68_24325 [Chitinophaga horti]|uniref:Cytochrome c domain-containing protein n=1 Tax=Chitinophaga horti TaxID=2920382 RepID=A0ABY6J0M0_9BACT|nr:hypothetical protein [Chitinophaga horti]UYQ93213.1 hypothetical protein MKQ68_24325 [Chitinophaga horti]